MKKKIESLGVITLRRDVKVLPVVLTEEELLARGSQLAQVESRIAEHNIHADMVKKDLKMKESALVAEQSRVASFIRNKAEPREVSVVAEIHGLEYRETRIDTGEVVFTRPAREEEMQGSLDLE